MVKKFTLAHGVSATFEGSADIEMDGTKNESLSTVAPGQTATVRHTSDRHLIIDVEGDDTETISLRRRSEVKLNLMRPETLVIS